MHFYIFLVTANKNNEYNLASQKFWLKFVLKTIIVSVISISATLVKSVRVTIDKWNI